MTRFPPECGTTHTNPAINLTLTCAKSKNHDGGHMTRRGTTWTEPQPAETSERSPLAEPGHCGKPGTWSDPDRYGRTVDTWCHRLLGHPGGHNPYAD